jgi:hypothetical protein
LHTAASAFLTNHNKKCNHFYIIAAILGKEPGRPQPGTTAGVVNLIRGGYDLRFAPLWGVPVYPHP